jgi:hypothetical protein
LKALGISVMTQLESGLEEILRETGDWTPCLVRKEISVFQNIKFSGTKIKEILPIGKRSFWPDIFLCLHYITYGTYAAKLRRLLLTLSHLEIKYQQLRSHGNYCCREQNLINK